MPNGPEDYIFVPPTSPEGAIDPYAHLRMDFATTERRCNLDPLQVFDEIGKDLVTIEDITAEDIVVMLQQETQYSLNTQGIRNLLGWASEELIRYKDSEKLKIMTPSQRIHHLYGVDIIFEDPAPKEVAG